MEIAPDIWEIEGYFSTSFFLRPPSCNIFVLRDKDLVLLVDTGTYPYYRRRIVELLRKFKREGARRLILMVTQGHFDHVANNDVIAEAGYDDVRFLLPEAEMGTINMWDHWYGEFLELEKYYDPYSMLPFAYTGIVNIASRISKKLARFLLKNSIKILFRGINTMADRAEILPMKSRAYRKYGDVEFYGWDVGRFFAIHDGSHSPGHLSFYDPKYKLLLTGDATVEINPPFFNSSLDKCIEAAGKFRRFAEQGYVQLATDSHRSSLWVKKLVEYSHREPLHPLQMVDVARGKEECIAFYRMFENYYITLKEEVLHALSELGEATVPELVEAFKKSKKPEAQLKTALVFPKVPSRLDVLVAVVLKESHAPRRLKGNDIVFSPPL